MLRVEICYCFLSPWGFLKCTTRPGRVLPLGIVLNEVIEKMAGDLKLGCPGPEKNFVVGPKTRSAATARAEATATEFAQI